MNKKELKKLTTSLKNKSVELKYQMEDGQKAIIKVKTFLPIAKRLDLVNSVIACLFVWDQYDSALHNSIKWYWILKNLTDLPLSGLVRTEVKEGQGIFNEEVLDEVSALIGEDGFISDITASVGPNMGLLLAEIEEAIEEKKIAVRDENSPAGKIVSGIQGILDAIGINLEDLKNIDVGKIQAFMGKLSQVNNEQVVDYIVNHQNEIEGEKQ